MPKYTDDQINEAIMQANQTSRVYSWETEMYRNVINHLPEPQDEWEECTFYEVKDTDLKVRAEYPGWTAEGKPQVVSGEVIKLGTSQGNDFRDTYFIHETDDANLYRIPKPVTPPDPAEHPVIIIYRPNGNGETPVSYAWTGQHYRSFDGQEYFSANEITDWSPAKVVATGEPVRPEDVGF